MAFNIFANDKQQNYPGYQTQQQPAVQQPDFAGDKAANYPGTQPTAQPAPQNKPTATPPKNTNNPVTVPVTNNPPVVDPTSPTSGMDYLSSMLTSPEQEERMRKATIANQRIMAVANALRHIGNIAHTVGYAPSQQFNDPVAEEQARYEKGKAVRDAANLRYYTYQQAKAAQDAKQKQWEADFNLKVADAARKAGYTEAQIKNMQDRLKQQGEHNKVLEGIQQGRLDETIRSNKARQESTDRHNRRMEGIAGMNAQTNRDRATAYINRQNGGNGNSKPTSLRGTNGWYSKKMNSDESQAFYNQTYEEMKKSGLIKEDAVLAGQPADIFGNKSISLAAKKAAVDNALMEHPEVGDWLADEFEFEFDPRYRESGTPMKPKANTPFQAPWSNNRGNPFEDRQPKGNSENNHKSNPFG